MIVEQHVAPPPVPVLISLNLQPAYWATRQGAAADWCRLAMLFAGWRKLSAAAAATRMIQIPLSAVLLQICTSSA